MDFRKTAVTLVTLLLAQMVGALALVNAPVSAQATDLVAVLSLYTGIDDCSVQYRRSTDGNWGANTIQGPPVACQGGLIVAEVMSQEQANQEMADAAGAGGTVEAASSTDGADEVRIIQLSGDQAADEAAIQAEIVSIHESVAPDSFPEEEESAFSFNTTLGFMGAEAVHEAFPTRSAPPVAPLTAQCRQGRINQERRADFAWNQTKARVTVKAYLYYKRVSCSKWKLMRIESKLLPNTYSRRIWLRHIELTKYWYPNVSGFERYIVDLGCKELSENRWETVSPSNVLFQGNSNAQIESIDTNPNSPSTWWSCEQGAGTSATSLWTYLPGGTR